MEACKRPGLAAVAEYCFPRGNEKVRGPSIRLAEELARCWGNLDYGIRELSRKDGVSEMEAYCWDMQTNTISSQKFTVRHIRDTRGGGKPLTEERDIYELTANMAGRRLRARIMAILPADIVEAAVTECRRTLEGSNTEPIIDRVRRMIGAFDRLGVRAAMLERWAEKPLTDILPEELSELTAIYNSIKEGVSKAGDWFDVPVAPGIAAADELNAQIKAAQTTEQPAPKVSEAPKADKQAEKQAIMPADKPAAQDAQEKPAPLPAKDKPAAANKATAPVKGDKEDDVF